MLGVLLNGATVMIGGIIGVLFKKLLKEDMQDALMKGLSIILIYFGISGAFCGENVLVEILSMVFGTLIGVAINIDRRFNSAIDKLTSKLNKKESNDNNIANGFINGTMVFCIGAVAILGPMEAGLTGDIELLVAKSLMDGLLAIILASGIGIGVAASSIPIVLYQGTIFLVAAAVAPYLSEYTINEMSCVGYLLIVAIGLNLLGLTNIKVMNYVPAMFIPIILCLFMH